MTRWNGLRSVVVVVAAVVVGLVMPTPAAAWVAFAKITTSAGTTIDGDVTAKGYEKQIAVLGLGNRLEMPITTSAGSTTVGRLQAGPIQIVKGFDSATPKLVALVGIGVSQPKVEITIFKKLSDNTSIPGFRITLTNAVLTQIDTTYDPGADPSTLEKIEFFYTKLQWTDLVTGATGSTP